MNKHLEKALLLFERRPQLAAREILAALAEDHEDPYPHALLALCLMNSNDSEGAFKEAKEAIRLDPEYPFAFYALSKCHYDQNNMLEAEVAIDEALRLEPWNATYWGLLSNIEIENRNYKEALKAAETGLEMSPEDVHCHNLKALIQTRLGNKEEAKHSLDTAMAADPENALTHAYRGWALIEHHNHAESIVHFREALRIDPTLEWARQGLIKALQVRHWAFQVPLKIGWRGAILMIIVFATSLAFLECSVHAPAGTPGEMVQVLKNGCLVGLVVAILVPLLPHTVLADPLLRFLLLFDQDGRLAMTREERVFNVHLMAFIFAIGIGIVYAINFSSWWVLAAIVFLYFATIPLTFGEEKRDRKLWLSMIGCAFLFGTIAMLFATPQYGMGSLRLIVALNLCKGLLAGGTKVLFGAAGFKALFGAIGLGAAATAMKEKEKKKIREQMLNQKSDPAKKTK